MSTLNLTNIEKCYPNGYQAIKKLDLDIQEGEFVVLVGPSGCGKSTLLRMIAGLETISGGDLYIDSEKVNLQEPGDRDIAMVFQNYALYPHMSVFNNMAYGLKNRKTPKAEIKRLVTEAAQMLEIEHLLDRKPKQLSGGQRQRVAMGRAIVRQPKVFLFDEPLSNLDAKLRVQMRLEIKKLQQRLSTTSIYVTHDQVEAMTLADKLVVLNQGKVEQVGKPIDLYDLPASTFVATFIGSPAMNIISGEVTRHGLRLNGQLFSVPTSHLVDGQIRLGLRPEHLYLCRENPWFYADVELIEVLGADQLIHCTTQGYDCDRVLLRIDGHEKVAVGDRLGIAIKPHHIHLFDYYTEKRIDNNVAELKRVAND